MAQRIKLLLLIPHLGGGGAERVAFLLARHLDPLRFETHLTLISQDFSGAQSSPPWVQVHRLGLPRVRQAWRPLLRLVRALQPDVVLSGMAHLNFLLLLLKPFLPRGTRVLVRQNTTASASAPTLMHRLFYRKLYPQADAILCQSAAMANDLAEHFAIPRSKLEILANPIEGSSIPTRDPAELHLWPATAFPRLLVAARLSREKGVDLLLHAFNLLRLQHPNMHAVILGSGPEEGSLHDLQTELQLQNNVTLAGFRQDLSDYYAAATLFVLPSRHEGIPNALLEAAAAGLPLVATPCSGGLCDLLKNAPGVWLASSITAESLAGAIRNALAALPAPQRFQHAFLAPFELSAAIAAYAALIERIAERGKS